MTHANDNIIVLLTISILACQWFQIIPLSHQITIGVAIGIFYKSMNHQLGMRVLIYMFINVITVVTSQMHHRNRMVKSDGEVSLAVGHGVVHDDFCCARVSSQLAADRAQW